jgi:hypothetical protein
MEIIEKLGNDITLGNEIQNIKTLMKVKILKANE